MKFANSSLVTLFLVAGAVAGCSVPDATGGSNRDSSVDSTDDGAWPDAEAEAGPDAEAEAGPDAEAGAVCPGTGGPAMVKTEAGYCIDSTEVSRGDYLGWLATSPGTENQPPGCSGNTDFTPGPSCSWPPSGDASLPVACVDWCDAYAYCAGVGKRLCGGISGGANPWDQVANPAFSQWFRACSSNGASVYPYGPTFESGKCNVLMTGNGVPLDVGSLSGCVTSTTGYAGVFDLSGNVWEWENSCNGFGESSDCHMRGGGYTSNEVNAACNNANFSPRNAQQPYLGFRCCS